MKEVSCNIIADMLPLYAENMASEETKAVVEAHLPECEHCRAALESLKHPPQMPKDDGTLLKQLRRRLALQRAKFVALACLVAFTLLCLYGVHMHAPISLSAEEAIVSVSLTEDGLLSVLLTPAVADYNFERGADGNIFITAWNTRYNQLQGRKAYRQTIIWPYTDTAYVITEETPPVTTPLTGTAEDPVGPQFRVYYYSVENPDRMDVLIYETENAPRTDYDGIQTLPRLVLNYYFAIAAVLGVVCAFLMILLRITRRHKSAQLMMHIALIFGCYAVSSYFVLMGHHDIYNVQYYLSAILMIAILAYLAVRFVMYLFRKPE